MRSPLPRDRTRTTAGAVVVVLGVLVIATLLFQCVLVATETGRSIKDLVWGLNVRQYYELLGRLPREIALAVDEQRVTDGADAKVLTAPEFSVPSGVYSGAVVVSARHDLDGVDLRYTLDGSVPSPVASRLPEMLTITRPVALRVKAFKSGWRPSRTASASYIVDDSIGDVPAVSIVLDPVLLYDRHAGIYVNAEMKGRAWERPAEVAVLGRGRNVLDPVEARLRIHGNASRHATRKSFRIYFERNYADVLGWILGGSGYGEDAPRAWVLRYTANNAQYLADRFVQKVARRLGLWAPAMKPCALYVNGSFWGVYDFAQRIDEAAIRLFENSKRDVVLLHGAPLTYPPVGAGGHDGGWHDLYDYIAESDLANPDTFRRVWSAMDLDNLIDYFALSVFMADSDRPHNNLDLYRLIDRSSGRGTKWRFASWDFDGGLNYRGAYVDHDTLAWHLRSGLRPDLKPYGVPDNETLVSSTTLLRALMQNRDFRRRFYTRFSALIDTELSTTTLQRTLAELEIEYAEVMPLERRKFGRGEHPSFEGRMRQIEEFITQRPRNVRRMLDRERLSHSSRT